MVSPPTVHPPRLPAITENWLARPGRLGSHGWSARWDLHGGQEGRTRRARRDERGDGCLGGRRNLCPTRSAERLLTLPLPPDERVRFVSLPPLASSTGSRDADRFAERRVTVSSTPRRTRCAVAAVVAPSTSSTSRVPRVVTPPPSSVHVRLVVSTADLF